MKKVITVSSPRINIDGNTLSNVISTLENLALMWGGGATVNFRCDYEGDTSFHVTTTKLETDKEDDNRLVDEFLLEFRAQRLAQYEDLKAEFGDK